MVQLKVIRGGRYQEECSDSPLKLFSAHSIVKHFSGREGVRFNWIVLGREKPVAPYEKLISGYACMDRKVRPYFEEHINELFTEHEMEGLRAHIMEHYPALSEAMEIVEEGLPASDAFIPMPFGSIPPGGGRDFHYLFREASYALPFKAGAYYDLRNCPLSSVLSEDSRVRGKLYVHEALKALGLNAAMDPTRLDQVVEILYATRGWYVDERPSTDQRCGDT